MEYKLFEKWLDNLGKAWISKSPDAASNLCSEDVIYFENPFLPPLKGKDAVKKVWLEVPPGQKDINFKYEILAVTSELGIARWTATFIRVPANTKAELEGIYLVKLDSAGLCKEFHQWWNSKSN